jgi:hypothetical protein
MPVPYPREYFQRLIDTYNECLEEGYPFDNPNGGVKTAAGETARRMGFSGSAMTEKLQRAKNKFGLEPDLSRYRPRKAPAPFTIDPLPHDGEPDAEELIDQLSARYAQRKTYHDAAKLRQVRVGIDGPIGLAFFGDPHIDDPGCAWTDLKRDVDICRRTEGVFAIGVGDMTNNWVGRLAKLYADQEVTSSQSLKLIEWLIGALPWLLNIKGNHDTWNTEKGDVADYIYRLTEQVGALETSAARLQLHFPNGANCIVSVRHDFPGGSQFNPAHALVRETLFGFRDHIMVCGHRHTAGYIPVWHNDPPRLCHGFRVGAYKDFDKYAREKGFQDGNWARAMGATIEPEFAHDPVRYIKPWFCLDEMAAYLTWRRECWRSR